MKNKKAILLLVLAAVIIAAAAIFKSSIPRAAGSAACVLGLALCIAAVAIEKKNG